MTSITLNGKDIADMPVDVPASLAARLNGQHGTVTLRDQYWPAPDGTNRAGVTGTINVVPAEDAIGCPVGRSEATWIATVEDDAGTQIVILPGCVVLGFHFHEGNLGDGQYWSLDDNA